MSDGLGESGGLVPVKLPEEINSKIEMLPKEQREPFRARLIEVVRSSFQGPFPPPDMLDDYERHSPGFLKTLMDRAIEAQRHEQTMDLLMAQGPLDYAKRGQYMGITIVVLGVIGATICALVGAEAVGVALGLTAAAPIVGHFVRNPLASAFKPSTPPSPPSDIKKPEPAKPRNQRPGQKRQPRR